MGNGAFYVTSMKAQKLAVCLNLLILIEGFIVTPLMDAYGRASDEDFNGYNMLNSVNRHVLCVFGVSFYTHAHHNYACHGLHIRFSFFVSGYKSFACEQMDYHDKRAGLTFGSRCTVQDLCLPRPHVPHDLLDVVTY